MVRHVTLTQAPAEAKSAARLLIPNLLRLSGLLSPYLVCFELTAANVSASQVTDKWWIM